MSLQSKLNGARPIIGFTMTQITLMSQLC